MKSTIEELKELTEPYLLLDGAEYPGAALVAFAPFVDSELVKLETIQQSGYNIPVCLVNSAAINDKVFEDAVLEKLKASGNFERAIKELDLAELLVLYLCVSVDLAHLPMEPCTLKLSDLDQKHKVFRVGIEILAYVESLA